LAVRAVFVGFTKMSHFDTVLEHARQNPTVWVNKWLAETNGDQAPIRHWFEEQILRSQKNAELAAGFGYGFFDITDLGFAEYAEKVKEYLLNTG
jgi:hypothetical protein